MCYEDVILVIMTVGYFIKRTFSSHELFHFISSDFTVEEATDFQ